MAQYKSKYPELGFYVGGTLRKFSHGKYETMDKDEIKVLDRLVDANRLDEPKPKKDESLEDVTEKPAAPKKKGGKSSGK